MSNIKNAVGAVLALCAFTASAQQYYYFKQKLPSGCNRHAVIISEMASLGVSVVNDVYAHGHFVRVHQTTKMDSPMITMHKELLLRPDLGDADHPVKKFEFGLGQCTADLAFLDPTTDLFTPLEMMFTNREKVTFHGFQCYKYTTSMVADLAVYGDHETGELLGLESGGAQILYRFSKTAPEYPASMFAFDAKNETGCDSDAYKVPQQKDFDKACSDVPTGGHYHPRQVVKSIVRQARHTIIDNYLGAKHQKLQSLYRREGKQLDMKLPHHHHNHNHNHNHQHQHQHKHHAVPLPFNLHRGQNNH